MAQAPPPSRCRLAGGDTPSLSASEASDCRRNRQNQTIRLAKPNYLVSAASSKSFRLVFDSCDNTFWQLHCGIDYFTHVKHEGGNSGTNGSDLDKNNILKLRHLDGGGSQGIQNLLHRSRGALPLAL
jgi:hypothetical protein